MTERHISANRRHWDEQAASYRVPARENWGSSPRWGIWGIPEADLESLPAIEGRDVVELGCGTAYVSSWMKRRGARSVVGIDNSIRQLETAGEMQREFDLTFPLLWGDAESLPLPSASFDVAISEYGACIWCRPERFLAEASRVLRPGGHLWFLRNSTLLMLCMNELEADGPATTRLRRPLFGMYEFDWPDEDGIEYHLPHGDWIRLLREVGFEIQALHELKAPEGARSRFEFVDAEWARRWPSEEIWVARKRDLP